MVSKNLHCVLNTVTLFHEIIGTKLTSSKLIDGNKNEQIKSIIHNLLIVVNQSKVCELFI